MAELGNLIARIVRPLARKSTVKIRLGSLFCTSVYCLEASRAAKEPSRSSFPRSSTGRTSASQVVHREPAIPACANAPSGCKVER